MAALIAAAGLLRLVGVEQPQRIYFDETYYVNDARSYLERAVEEERPAHPPLGKWVLAAGIAVAGDGPLGWRLANVVAGTATVALVVAGGRLLTRSWWPALLAGLLVAVDGLSFVGSRIAMLDASLGLWVTGAFVLLVLDARRSEAASPWPSPWRVAGLALLGLAVATKWSGVLALAAGFALAGLTDARASVAERGRQRSDRDGFDGKRPGWRGIAPWLLLRLVLPFAVIPVAVYVASYVPWLVAYEATETADERCEEGHCGTGLDDRLAGLWQEHVELVSFHHGLEVSHPARAEAWRWPLLDRPVLIFLERCRPDPSGCPFDPGEERRILALGNPGLWWPALVLVPALGVVGVRRRSWQAAAVLAFVLLQWLPWFLVKPGFSFYLIPVAPFVALAVALLAWHVRARGGRWLAVVLAVAAVAAFVAYRPLLVGSVLDQDRRERLALLNSWD